ncbi:MAG: nucleoside-triphosphatase [Gracilibacteraceae bacterium]|jgi:nucleoside-triphosphatase|nr:nucleoside-triphosphatase [Gracilibacteraceae bacterium]
MNLFLTGERGVGKTTLLHKILATLPLRPAGFWVSRDLGPNGRPLAFYLNDYLSGERRLMAKVSGAEGRPPVAVPGIFTGFGADCLEAAQDSPLVVLDELGLMEEGSPRFIAAVHELLDRSGYNPHRLTLGVLRLCEGNFVRSIRERKDVTVVTVAAHNRDALLQPLTAAIAENFTGNESLGRS